MLVQCNNKSCVQSTDAQYDVETGSVMCLECEQPITNISESMKRVLKSSGQIVRKEVRKAFTMGCTQCRANREVVLNTKGDTVCSVCMTSIAVHSSMRLAMEEAGAKLKQLTAQEESERMKAADKKQARGKKKTKSKKSKKKASKKTGGGENKTKGGE